MDKNDDKSQEYNKPLVTKTKGIIQDLEIIKKKMEQQVHMLNNSSSNNSIRIQVIPKVLLFKIINLIKILTN